MKYRIIVAIILIVALLVTGILIYLNNVFLPVQLKSRLIRELEKNLNKNVSIESLRYNLLEGLIMKNISVTDRGAEKALLEIKRISFNLLIFPLLQKKIIIPVLHIDSPKIDLKLKKDNTLNIIELLPKQKTEKVEFAVLISKLDISNGTCHFLDERFNYAKEIADLKIGAGLNLPSHIKFIVQAKISNLAADPSFISVSGEYNLLKQDLRAKLKLNNIAPNDYILYLENLPFLITQGIIGADLEISLKDKQLNIKGKSAASDIRLKKDKFTLTGNIDIEPDINYNLEKKNLTYKGRMGISKAVFSGVEALKDILDIQGNIYFENGKIWSDDLKAQLLNSPLEFKGNINLLENQLIWENVSVTYKENQYNSAGNIQDFQQPKIDFNITSKDLALNSNLIIKDKLIKIEACKGKYLTSEFTLRGNIDNEDANNPLLNLNLNLNLNLQDVVRFIPANINETLQRIQAEGSYNISGDISGSIKDIKTLDTSLEVSSPQTKVYGFKLDNIYFTLAQRNGLLNINDFTAGLYSGNAKIRLSADIAGESPNYSANIMLTNIDLAQLKLDTKLKDSDFAGTLDMQLSLQGKIKDLETLQGQGTAAIKDGKLWELNFFKGLGELLFTPIYKKTIFKEAQTNFSIENKYLYLKDASLKGDELSLQGEGKIGFDSSLDLTLNSEINENLIQESPDLRKFTSLIFGNLLAIKINGTLQKPEYKVVTPAKQIINQIKRLILPHLGN